MQILDYMEHDGSKGENMTGCRIRVSMDSLGLNPNRWRDVHSVCGEWFIQARNTVVMIDKDVLLEMAAKYHQRIKGAA